MKKLLTLFALFTLAAMAMAQTTVTFDASVDKGTRGSSNAGLDSVAKGGVTVAISKGCMNLQDQYRCYKGETMTITSTVGNITNVEITCDGSGTSNYGPGHFTVTDGTYTYSGKVGTWTGNAASVVFTAGAQVRPTKIVVTIGGTVEDGVAAPVFSYESGTYYNPFEVTITCPTTGATIEYSLNNAAYAAYTAPVAITGTSTLSARASKGDKVSEVTTAQYVFGTAVEVASIAAYYDVADSTYVRFTSPVTVLAQNGQSLYVQDGTGQMLIYGPTGQKYTNGQSIPAGFSGKKVPYNGEYELAVGATDGFQAGVEGAEVEPELIQCADVEADLWGTLVSIKGVTFEYTENSAGSKSMNAVHDNSGRAAAHNGMGLNVSGFDYTKEYDITAIIGSYRKATDSVTTYQVLPLTAVIAGSQISVAEYQTVADSAQVAFKNPLTVLAQKGKRLFVKDNTGYMLVYGDVNRTYTLGNVIPAGASGQKVTYDGEPELINPTNFKASSSTVEVQPEEVTAAFFKHDNFAHYVVVKNATFATGDTIYDAAGNIIPAFFNMNASKPNDLTKAYDVYGVVGSHGKTNTVYQILPTLILPAGTDPNALPEVADIQALFDLDKGTKAKITSDIIAIYQHGNNLYIKNGETYSLAFGSLAETFENGDIIRNAVASWTEYQGLKQLSPVDSTWTVAAKGDAVEPIEMALEEMGQDMAHTYFIVKNATLVCDSTNYYTVNDGTLSMTAFNRFEVNIPTIEEGKTYDVKCFLTVYKNKLQLYPVEVTTVGGDLPGVVGDVNGDNKVDVADLNAVLNLILSAGYDAKADTNNDNKVDVSDLNDIINILLNN